MLFFYKRGKYMIEILILIFIVWAIAKARSNGTSSRSLGSKLSSLDLQKRSGSKSSKKATAVPNQPKTAAVPNRQQKTSAAPNRQQKASAAPNKPKKIPRTKDETAMAIRTRASSAACNYEAAYSKGRPERIGLRADYEPVVPSGKVRVRCPYCGAENFVPATGYDHYHCYFCWEKL